MADRDNKADTSPGRRSNDTAVDGAAPQITSEVRALKCTEGEHISERSGVHGGGPQLLIIMLLLHC